MLYVSGLLLGAPYLLYKTATTGKYRKGLAQRFGAVKRRQGEQECVWFHSVSVGELLAAEPLIRGFAERHPDVDIALSVTTSTGFEIASKRFSDLNVFFYPLDLSWVVRSVLDRIRPTLVVLVELELWPNFLREAADRGIPVVLTNGRISRKSFLYYRHAWFALKCAFDGITRWGVQNESYAKRLKDLGLPPGRITVGGSTKYDTIPTGEDAQLRATLRDELRIAPDDLVIVGGSTFSGEEAILLDVFLEARRDFPEVKLILVPRHPERWDEVRALLDRSEVPWRNRTDLEGALDDRGADVILLDTMGELAKIYACGDVVFVGKSLCGRGGQNMLEPAARGRAVLFGPHVANFRETVDLLLDREAAVQVADPDELLTRVKELLASPERRDELGRRACWCIDESKGATDHYLDMIDDVLSMARKE